MNMSGVLVLLTKARGVSLSHLYLQEFGLQYRHVNKHSHCIIEILSVRPGGLIALSSYTHPRTASRIPASVASPCAAWWKESCEKADGGRLLCLCTCCFSSSGRQLRQESIRQVRETWEYGCQTVATGAPGKLPTRALICCLHSSEVWWAQSTQLYPYQWFLPEESKS